MKQNKWYFGLLLVLLVGAVGLGVSLRVLKQRGVINSQNSAASGAQSGCSQYERSWGDWCVYTWSDGLPDKIVWGFDNIYHPSVWLRNGQWNMVAGGWKSPAKDQQYRDRVYQLRTSDPYGITGWQLVPGAGAGGALVDNAFENAASTDVPREAYALGNSGRATAYESFHTVQPDVVPVEQYPRQADGSTFPCCDALYYSYDYAGAFPEKQVGVHMGYFDAQGVLQRAGRFGAKNPALDWRSYGSLGGNRVAGVSDARVTYDPQTKQFYMVYGEWWDSHKSSDGGSATTSLASAGWTNQKFTVVKRNLLDMEAYAGNPQIVVGPDAKYYLFYTRFSGGIFVASADNIAGPYTAHKQVLAPKSGFTTVGTPYVFCNTNMNQWQMYFYASTGGTDNQIYTAFLHKSCANPPVL
jgi:hypothetical protein